MAEPVKDLLRSLSVGDLRQLLAIKESQAEIEKLMQKRDDLLVAAEGIQRQIDELIISRCRGESGRRMAYGKRMGPTVKQMCEEVMIINNSPMTAAEVKSRILEKWPERNSHTLYNQVFIALGRSDLFKKVKKGRFAIRDGVQKLISERKEKMEAERRGLDGSNGGNGSS